MYRVRSRSLITEEIVESEHTLSTREDAETVVSFFNTIYKHLFQYWFEPVNPEHISQSTDPIQFVQPVHSVQLTSIDQINDYYLF